MNRQELEFARPAGTDATVPPEARGVERDGVRLMVTTPSGTVHARFRDLPGFLDRGDLLVVNRSQTLPARLPARGAVGDFWVHLSTHFGRGLWLLEPRWGPGRPGPLPLSPGETIRVGEVDARLIGTYPDLPRLWFAHAQGDLAAEMRRSGRPIRYGYLAEEFPIESYETVFGDVPGSAEMPSAARPFTLRMLRLLADRSIRFAGIVLHTGVSSLEVESETVEGQAMIPEPFSVAPEAAAAVNEARGRGNRIVAVGTTVVRALESAWKDGRLHSARGFTRRLVMPGRPIESVDGLLTGFHDRYTSHLAMLFALAGADRIRAAYRAAGSLGYLWHEFGDSQLILNR